MCSLDQIPSLFLPSAREAARAMQESDQVLVATHVNPDGDAIGSAVACAELLHAQGKAFALFIPQGIPHYLDFLQNPWPIYGNLCELPFAPRWAVFLDCSQVGRLPQELEYHWESWRSINIDHHICDGGLGTEANFIFTQAAATCQLMAYVAMAMQRPLRGMLARAIGVGLIGDTGNFSHGNTTGDVFALAAALEYGGTSLPDLAEQLRSVMPVARLRLYGALFSQVQVACDGKLAWCMVYGRDLQQMGCTQEDLEGLIDWLRKIQGVEIALVVRQTSEGQSKFSLRSRGAVDVQTLAAQFGGGGHKNAAGGSLACDPREAVDRLLPPLESYLRTL